jgi:RHS repeat-associated protein
VRHPPFFFYHSTVIFNSGILFIDHAGKHRQGVTNLCATRPKGGATLDGATYTVDNAGNRLTRTPQPSGTASTYGYDNIYELLSVTQGGSTTESYTYDPVGNRLTSLGSASWSYNMSNELNSRPSNTYTYDNNGNTQTMANASGTTTYTWDFENRLTSATLPGSGGTVSFKYDPLGRRIYKSSSLGTSIFAYDGNNLIEETNSSGAAVTRYSQSLNIDEPLAMLRSGTTSYYQADGLGSVSSLTNTAGAAAQNYTYDSFGNILATAGSLTNSFRYTGREFDTEINLYYYRSRYYDASSGRFLSEDPLGFLAGINKYAYVLNDPTKYRDPAGLWPWDSYFKNKTLEDQAESDQRIFDMTSRFASDPFLNAKCLPGIYLAQINQLAYSNLEIDHVLAGGSALGLMMKYPEVIGKPQDQMQDMFGKLRDANNKKSIPCLVRPLHSRLAAASNERQSRRCCLQRSFRFSFF